MTARVLLLLLLSAGLAGAQTLERFSPLVRANETYFAGPWSSAGQQPAASFVQSGTEYDITGVTNDGAGYVDIYAPASGPLFGIGSSTALEVTAKVLSGNATDVFRIFLIDHSGNTATATFRTADFSAADFTTVGRTLALPTGFDPTAIDRIRISGDASGGTAAFAIAFRELDAVARAGGDGVLRNFSLRARVGTGDNIFIAGFVVTGDATTPALVRAVGPGLAAFGISDVLADPRLSVFRSNSLVATNDNWSNDATMQAATNTAGAFGLSTGSRDAAVVTTLSSGVYTAQADGVGGTSGFALLELYDLSANSPYPTQRFVEVSARAAVGSGDAQLIGGFVVTGHSAKRLLIRAAGPALASFGLASGYVADPLLTLVRVGAGGTVVQSNDNWQNGNDLRELTGAAVQVGAFPFAAGSRDAAMLVTVPPGAYSAIVGSAGGGSGIALLEIYEVP